MEKMILWVSMLLICSKSFGQTDTLHKKEFKNEISVNVSSVFVVALGGLPYDPSWGGAYKRSIRNDCQLRAGFYVSQKKYYTETFGYGNINGGDWQTTQHTDSTLVRTLKMPWQSPVCFFQLGIESELKKKRMSLFSGGDVVIGWSEGGVNNHEAYYTRDTMINNTGTYADWLLVKEVPADSGSYRKEMKLAGLFCFAGIQYPLYHRIGISASIGVYPLFMFGKLTNLDAVGNTISTTHFSEIHLYLNNIIHDLSLTYRF